MSSDDSTARCHVHLPLELRCALDLIAQLTSGPNGTISGHLIGSPVLIEAVSHYAPVSTSPNVLVVLMASPDMVRATLANNPAGEVWTLTAGPLDRLLRPLRSRSNGCVSTTQGLPARRWTELGYVPTAVFGIQGFGSMAWAIGERLCRRIGRPDFADRCRIGMLRTIVTARPLNLGAIQIHRYQRKARR